MSRKPLYLLITIFFLLSLLLTSCSPKAAPESVKQKATAEEAPPAAVEEEASDEIPCDFDEQTCEFLKGQDFTGKTLVVGVWGGDIEKILREVVIPPLEARGARIELLLGGAGDRLAKIYAEKDNPTMDIAYINIHTAAQAVQDGVVEPASDEIPAYADLYDFAKSNGYGMSITGVGILYSKSAFSSPPEWADLWKPEYKGKIAFPTFPSTGADAMMAVAGRLEGGDEHDTDIVFNKIAQLKPVPMVFTSNDELNLMMDKGDIVAAPQLSAYAWAGVDQYESLGFSWPKDPGPMLAMDVLCIVKGTKNRDLALAWTQIALSPKTQQAYAERIYFGPTNSKVQISGDLTERVIYGQERLDSLLKPDYPYIAEIRKDLVERWNKEIIKD
ncbi:MAG: extracellular solute-binding protein [Anaerolineaceae bacterium]|nr:extracellular solute-binding protein [Anaerolineaceae bacterium]